MRFESRAYHFKELTDICKKSTQPNNWSVKLKSHQLAAIQSCIDLENIGIDVQQDRILEDRFNSIKSNIGIIGDKVGSGKSYTILGLIANNDTPLIRFNHTMMYGNNNINVELKNLDLDRRKVRTSIIVVPHGIVKQWEKCILTADSRMSYFIVNTTKSLTSLDSQDLDSFKVLIVSGTFFGRVQRMLLDKNISVNRLVFDEVDSMNTPNAKHLSAAFYWFVSASYKNILNPYPRYNYEYRPGSSGEYMLSSGIANNVYAKNIFMNFYRSHNPNVRRLIDQIVVKNSDDFVDKSFELPDFSRKFIRCRDSGLISILNGVVHSNIIQCLNAGDVAGAVSHINAENVDTETNIVEAVIQGLSIKLNNTQVELRSANETIFVNEDIKRKRIAKLTTDLQSIETKISLIKQRIHASEMCTICLERPQVKTITKCCNNSFCLQCLTEWLRKKPSCPLCKSSMLMDRDVFVVKDDSMESEADEEPTKLQYLDKILSETNDDSRILIFSEYDSSFMEIENLLRKHAIKYSRLKGNGINRSVDEYRNGNLQVLLVNSTAYGSGLNLENTTDVVLFHKMDNDIESQVIGRAQRPGRTSQLKAWYLLNKNEYDKCV
tara:strand:- start:378 stop:2195 length:1818 start_codon:yes stop_codon:yes gene_type:complete